MERNKDIAIDNICGCGPDGYCGDVNDRCGPSDDPRSLGNVFPHKTPVAEGTGIERMPLPIGLGFDKHARVLLDGKLLLLKEVKRVNGGMLGPNEYCTGTDNNGCTNDDCKKGYNSTCAAGVAELGAAGASKADLESNCTNRRCEDTTDWHCIDNSCTGKVNGTC